MPEAYDKEEAQQILQLAMLKQGQSGSLLRSQLVEIAEELGISSTALAAAEEEWQFQIEERQARQEFTAFRHRQLRRNIVQHVVLNTLLVLLNIATTHRIDWAIYPVVIWAIALLWEAWQVLWPEDEQYNRAFRRWRLRQQIGESFKAISERFQLSRSIKDSPNPDGSPSDSDIGKREQPLIGNVPQGADSMSLTSIAPDNQISVKSLSDEAPSLKLGQISPAQRSRLQNRVNHHASSHNRISSFSHQNQRGAEQNGADHIS